MRLIAGVGEEINIGIREFAVDETNVWRGGRESNVRFEHCADGCAEFGGAGDKLRIFGAGREKVV